MLADRGCYEERYRLSGRTIVGLVVGAASAGLGVIWNPPEISAASVILALPAFLAAAAVALALPGIIAVARGRIAFRADAIGLTLGAVPDSVPAVRRPADFVPWADIERIVLHLAETDARASQPRGSQAQVVRNIAIQRRAGAIPLSAAGRRPPGPVVGYTVVGYTAGRPALDQAVTRLTRSVTGWRLDRDRLAALAAVLAPGVQIIEAGLESAADRTAVSG